MALTPISRRHLRGRWGELLVMIHRVFRAELAAVRKELAQSGPGLVAQLRANCVSFCHDLHEHHTGESGRMFPLLAEHHPGLASVLARLEREHEVVKRLLEEIQELLRSDRPGEDVLRAFDRLAGELEAHLDYEEEQLAEALNTVTLA